MAESAGSLGMLSYNFGGAGGGAPAEEGRKAPSPDLEARKSISEKAQAIGDAIGRRLSSRYERWQDARRWIEEEWLKNTRAYHGKYEYDTEVRLRPNQSSVFVQLTRMKTDTSYNRICDLMLGPEDHWDLKHSPMPDVDPKRREELEQMIMQASMMDPEVLGMSMEPPTEEEIDQVEEKLAKKAAKRMRMKIKDQLEYAEYRKHFRRMVFEMCVLGTGVFKGPMVSMYQRPRWVRMQSADEVDESRWELNEKEEIIPKISSPTLFDVYPDPFASETQAGLGVFERHVLIASQLDTLQQQPFFIQSAIQKVKETYPGGNHWDTYTDLELRFTSDQNLTSESEHRFDVIEYWGWLTGAELLESAPDIQGIDPWKNYYCNVWFCGGITIKATVAPMRPQKQMYRLVPYKEVISSQYGVGIPYLMKDSQETVNAASRELINNAALSSGPQVEVAVDLIELDANEDFREITPWRVWPRAGGDMAQPAVRFNHVPNTTDAMANIIQIWRAFADEETNIPSYSHGSTNLSGAAGKTASGMSMLMGAASLDIKGVVQNIDQYLIKPFIEDMYHFNMQWSDDESLKGDMEPEATGSSALLAKEIKSQRVVMLLQMTNNPIDLQIMGMENRAKLLRAAGQAMDIDPDDMAMDPDEMTPEAMMAQQNQQMGGAPMGPGMPPGPGGPPPGQPGAGPLAAGKTNPGAAPDQTMGGPGMNQQQPGQPPVVPVTGQ